LSLLACLAALGWFVVNLLGWNLYLCIDLGSHTCAIAAACGVSYNAIEPSYDAVLTVDDQAFLDQIVTTLVEFGPFHLFAEQREEMMPFRFSVFDHGDGHVGFQPELFTSAVLMRHCSRIQLREC